VTRLKICGLRDAKHALVSAKAGADFLGFNFVPGVRRQISTERAQEIIASYRQTYGEGGPRLVGLFADQPLDDVNRIVASCGLDMAQLCGDEDAEYWGQVSVPLIKQIKVRDAGDPTSTVEQVALTVESVVASGHIAVLDSYEAGSLGGTGMTFDWSIAREVAGRHDIVLAGGLKPETVANAIAEVGPWGVDVSSGVETDGVKDSEKIRHFAEVVLSPPFEKGGLGGFDAQSARAPEQKTDPK
jgi:phosphoribosylanthranilate isomerase